MELAVVTIFIVFGFLGHKFFEDLSTRLSTVCHGYWPSLTQGRELLAEAGSYFSRGGHSKTLPRYKFFNPLFSELKTMQIQNGLSSVSILKKVRPWLLQDLQFEEKVRGVLFNSLAQFLVVSSFTWIFFYSSTSELNNKAYLIAVFFLQLLGGLSFVFLFQRERQRKFALLECLFQKAFLFLSYKGIGLSMGEVLAKSQADQGLNAKDSQLRNLDHSLIALCQKWTKEGVSIDEDLEEVLSELEFLRDQRRRKFETSLYAKRFIHLVVFFLSGYFVVVYGLIRQLALSY